MKIPTEVPGVYACVLLQLTGFGPVVWVGELRRDGRALEVQNWPGGLHYDSLRLLDLFCGAGGAGVGYSRAGFDVVGVDIEAHPDYPLPMMVMDAMDTLRDLDSLAGFDVIHASPPCQGYSLSTPASTRDKHPRLIGPVRMAVRQWGGVYVIENVQGARPAMCHPVKLCGSSFGLGVRRHRLFESNALLMGQPCAHNVQGVPYGVYGDHPEELVHLRPETGTSRARKARTIAHGREVMGIDWMTDWDDLTDAIPPVFTEYLGAQLLDQLAVAA